MEDAQLARDGDVLEQELDGQFLLLRTGSSDVVHLDTVGSDVWRLLEAPSTRAQLTDALASAYEVEPARVAADLVPLLQVLLQHRLITEDAAS